MKKLVIYYSLEGNTRLVAESVAEMLEADILELKPKKDLDPKSFMRYFWGGKQVLMKETPELLPFDKKIEDYDLIFIGTPVWAQNYAPAIRTLFSKVKFDGKKVAVYCTHMGDIKGLEKTLNNMKKEVAGSELVGDIDFFKPFRDKEGTANRAKKWALFVMNTIKEREEEKLHPRPEF